MELVAGDCPSGRNCHFTDFFSKKIRNQARLFAMYTTTDWGSAVRPADRPQMVSWHERRPLREVCSILGIPFSQPECCIPHKALSLGCQSGHIAHVGCTGHVLLCLPEQWRWEFIQGHGQWHSTKAGCELGNGSKNLKTRGRAGRSGFVRRWEKHQL